MNQLSDNEDIFRAATANGENWWIILLMRMIVQKQGRETDNEIYQTMYSLSSLLVVRMA